MFRCASDASDHSICYPDGSSRPPSTLTGTSSLARRSSDGPWYAPTPPPRRPVITTRIHAGLLLCQSLLPAVRADRNVRVSAFRYFCLPVLTKRRFSFLQCHRIERDKVRMYACMPLLAVLTRASGRSIVRRCIRTTRYGLLFRLLGTGLNVICLGLWKCCDWTGQYQSITPHVSIRCCQHIRFKGSPRFAGLLSGRSRRF